MVRKLKLLILVLVAFPALVFAQQRDITGTVVDDEGVPLAGVTVVVEGTTRGAITDGMGKYSIRATSEENLQFRFIGMNTETVPVGDQTVIDVQMQTATEQLEDVVVVGYGTQKKASVVAAITQTTSDEIKQRGNSSNLVDMLSGALPGTIIQTSTGVPGGGGNQDYDESIILIRGKSTWNNASPLILVDGVERRMQDVDINEIETISVLKDASATAVFGVKGANGVILITTKRGKIGKPKLNVEASTSMKWASKIPTVLNSYNSIQARNYAILNEVGVLPSSWDFYVPDELLEYYRTGEYPDGFPDQDWPELMLRDHGAAHKINMNVSGGTERVKYFSSLSYTYEGDILNAGDFGQGYDPEFRYDRYNFRTNLDFKLTKTTNLSVNLSGYLGEQQKPGASIHSGMWYAVYAQPHDHPVLQYEDGTYGHGVMYERFGDNGFVDLNFSGTDRENRSEVNTDFKLTQKLDFITKGLSVSGMFSFDNFVKSAGPNITDEGIITKWVLPEYYLTPDADIEDYTSYFYPESFTTGATHGFDYYDLPLEYSTEFLNSSLVNATRKKIYYRANIDYARTFGKHEVTALALFSREEFIDYSGTFAGWPQKREDWVSRITYNYDNRYFLDLNGAYNGSEKFGPDYKFDFFPSAGVSWMVSNENFFADNLPFINTLKLRYTLGYVGNDKVGGVGQWPYVTLWETGGNWQFGFPFVNGPVYYSEGVPGNPDLHWEKSRKQNVGFEFGAFKNLITVSMDVFNEHRYDILIAADQRSVPEFFGQVPVAANLGIVDSKGYEIEAKLSKAYANSLRFYIGGNWTRASNMVVFKEDPEEMPFYQKQAGYPIGQNRSSVSYGFIESWDDMYLTTLNLGDNTQMLPGDYMRLDYNADGYLDNDDSVPWGYPNYPMNTYGLTLGGSYKGFGINVQFYGQTNITESVGLSLFAFDSPTIYRSQVNDTWLPEYHNENPTMRSITFKKSAANANYADYDATFLRLKSAEVSYTLQAKWLKNAGVSNLRFYANGNNLFLWSYMPIDVEGQGYNLKNYPVTKMVNFGVSVTF